METRLNEIVDLLIQFKTKINYVNQYIDQFSEHNSICLVSEYLKVSKKLVKRFMNKNTYTMI